MILKYLSGEEVKAGDHVLYAGESGQIEFVAEPGHPESDWFFQQYGPGCMILAPACGRVFEQPDDHLVFVSRGKLPAKDK
jgi:hypothetical protein